MVEGWKQRFPAAEGISNNPGAVDKRAEGLLARKIKSFQLALRIKIFFHHFTILRASIWAWLFSNFFLKICNKQAAHLNKEIMIFTCIFLSPVYVSSFQYQQFANESSSLPHGRYG